MLLDESKSYPMTFIVQISFSGSLDRQKFGAAVKKALQRHPLLRAIVQPRKQNRDCWVESKQEFQIDFGELTDDIVFDNGEFIDLRNQVGLRMWIRHDANEGVITAQFHHSVCDGIGSYQFLGDALWFYADQTDDTDLPELPELDVRELRNRLRATFNPENYVNSDDRYRSEWRSTARWYCQQVNRLKIPKDSKRATSHHAFPGIKSIEFDKVWYRKFRKVAQSVALTSNELLLEKLFITLSRWNRQNGGTSLGRLSIMVPLDLRESKTSAMPAANVVTYAFVQARQSLLKHVNDLRDKLRHQMTLIKNARHSSRFTNMIVGWVNYPRLMRIFVAIPKCLATATLSNTGDPSKRFHVDFPKEEGEIRCGNLRITGFSGVPPMRPNTRATTSVFTYRRGLKICMRCDPHNLTPEDTKALLGILEQELRSVVDDNDQSG